MTRSGQGIASLDKDTDDRKEDGEGPFERGVAGAMARQTGNSDRCPKAGQHVPDHVASHCASV